MKLIIGILLTASLFLSSCSTLCNFNNENNPVTFVSMLEEMTDLKKLSEVPSPKYSCKQFSSYDRASTNPNDLSDTNWFANADCGQFLRTENNNGTNEFVMMESEGPGAIVRIWSANANGIIRIYLDGNPKPAIEMPMMELVNGTSKISPAPISGVHGLGQNCYLPIPYAKHCKVTLSVGGIYYHINYRSYASCTKVETFSLKNAKNSISAIKKVADKLSNPEKVTALPGKYTRNKKGTNLKPNQSFEIELKGQKAIYNFICKVDAENMEEALRGALLEISFDGQKPSVESPLGDFFGTAPGLNTFKSIPLGVLKSGKMYCNYVMGFKEKAKIKITNYSSNPINLSCEINSGTYKWTDRSQYFFAKWRSLNNQPTKPRIDWTLLDCKGEGTYLGNMYQVSNPIPNWWGEGDEKIYLDGEKFPSTFGTGTEDYYGYAWCWFGTFSHAFHNQVRSDGPANFGHSCVSRFHFLDVPLLPALIACWQGMERSGGRALWWFENKPGDVAEIEFLSKKAGSDKVLISSSKGPIFGKFNISINGQPAKEQLNLRDKNVHPSGEINLGVFPILKGKNKIKVEVVKEAKPPNNCHFFLLDYIKLETQKSQ